MSRSTRNSLVSYTGGYRRWVSEERTNLMATTGYTKQSKGLPHLDSILKFFSPLEHIILEKISGNPLNTFCYDSSRPIYIHRIVRYFVKPLNFVPLFIDANGVKGKSEDYKVFRFRDSEQDAIVALLNSSLFYWFWRANSDGFHCGYGDVYAMPYKLPESPDVRGQLLQLQESLMHDLNYRSKVKSIRTKKGAIQFQEFYTKYSKSIIDTIDKVLSQQYGFTDEELDFIIKYRLGQDSENEG